MFLLWLILKFNTNLPNLTTTFYLPPFRISCSESDSDKIFIQVWPSTYVKWKIGSNFVLYPWCLLWLSGSDECVQVFLKLLQSEPRWNWIHRFGTRLKSRHSQFWMFDGVSSQDHSEVLTTDIWIALEWESNLAHLVPSLPPPLLLSEYTSSDWVHTTYSHFSKIRITRTRSLNAGSDLVTSRVLW